MPEVIQQVYRQHLQEGWPGMIARPNVAHKYMSLKVYVPTNGRNPRPGDAVVYDSTRKAVRLPTSDAEERQVIGIVSYDIGVVGSTLDSTPSGSNSDAYVEFKDGSFALVATFGVFYGTAGGAASYGDVMAFNRTDNDWEVATDTVIASLGTSGDLTALPDAVGDTATLAEVRTFTQALQTALVAQKAEIEAFGDNITGYPGRLPYVTIRCDNEEGAVSGGLVKLNIGVMG